MMIERKGDDLHVVTPKNSDFIEGVKKLGGRWSGTAKAGVVSARQEERVRALCLRVYGEDGSAAAVDRVTVRVRLMKPDGMRMWDYTNPAECCGRVIAQRWGRDQSVKFDGAIISGGFPDSGGSVKNPRLAALSDTVLEIYDVPRVLALIEQGRLGSDAIEIVGGSIPASAPSQLPEAAVLAVTAFAAALAGLDEEDRGRAMALLTERLNSTPAPAGPSLIDPDVLQEKS